MVTTFKKDLQNTLGEDIPCCLYNYGIKPTSSTGSWQGRSIKDKLGDTGTPYWMNKFTSQDNLAQISGYSRKDTDQSGESNMGKSNLQFSVFADLHF